MSSANESASFSQLAQVINGKKTPSHKWFSLQENILDGSFHPITSDGSGEIGWWGSSLSGADGSFATAPELTITFPAQEVMGLTICGDSLLEEFPVNFSVQVFNGETLIKTFNVTGNSLIDYQVPLEQVRELDKMILTVFKVNKAGRTVKIVEAFKEFILRRGDALQVALRDSQLKRKASSDLVTIQPLVDADLFVEFGSKDVVTLQVNTSEKTKMRNIHTIMRESEREIFGEVEISYSDPYTDTTIEVEVSEIGVIGSAKQLADGLTIPKYKWLSLHDNKLNGSYFPIQKKYSIGWWGIHLSDASGVLTPQPKLTVTFVARAVDRLRLVGDSLLDNYPVDFTITCYDASDEVLYVEEVTGNTEVDWRKNIDSVGAVVKLEATIAKISKPFQVPKVTEFYTAVKEVYTKEEIVSMHLIEELQFDVSTVALGDISSNEIEVLLDNTDKRFNIGNTQSPVNGYLKKNRRINAWLSAEIQPGTIERHPLGTFWSVSWSVPDQGLTARVIGRDRLELLRLNDFTSSVVYQNKSLYWLFQKVLTVAELVQGVDYYLDSTLQEIVVPWVWFDRMSFREALARLAGCAIINVYCDRSGLLNIKRPVPMPLSLAVFDEDNVFNKERPNIGEEVTNYVEVSANIVSIGDEQEIIRLDESLSIPAGSSHTVELTFNQIPCVDVQTPVFTAAASISITDYQIFAWGVIITFTNADALPQEVTALQVLGKPLKMDNQKLAVAQDLDAIREDGKLPSTFSHDFIQNYAYAQQLANELLSLYRVSPHNVTLDSRGDISLGLAARITSPDFLSKENKDYTILRQKSDWNGAFRAQIDIKQI